MTDASGGGVGRNRFGFDTQNLVPISAFAKWRRPSQPEESTMRTNNAPLSHHRRRAGITRQGTCPVIHPRRAHPALHAGQKTRTHEGLKVPPGLAPRLWRF